MTLENLKVGKCFSSGTKTKSMDFKLKLREAHTSLFFFFVSRC